jgi:acetyl esterase/lipase
VGWADTVAVWGQAPSAVTRTEDVIYGRRDGTALTLDVFTPKEKANGAAIIQVISGGWFSSHGAISGNGYPVFADRGYTVFAVVHRSNPRFTIQDAVADLNRAVRFIRTNATRYKIDPERLGITGGSAGGHLSLMIGTAGSEGASPAPDPVERASSRVQAVACFFPPTDFLNWGSKDLEVTKFPALATLQAPFVFYQVDQGLYKTVTDHEKWRLIAREVSPLYHVSSKTPPTLIVHGDKDRIVPLQQAQAIMAKFKENKVTAQLIVKEGKDHGWGGMEKDLVTMADWFDKYLAAPKK